MFCRLFVVMIVEFNSSVDNMVFMVLKGVCIWIVFCGSVLIVSSKVRVLGRMFIVNSYC